MVKKLLAIKKFYLIIKDCQKLVYSLPFCTSFFFLHIFKNDFELEHGHVSPPKKSQKIFSVYLRPGEMTNLAFRPLSL